MKELGLVLLGILGTLVSSGPDQWEVADGYQLSVHSEGFELPTAITWVGTEQVLYYVTELNGTVKAVDPQRQVTVVGQVQVTVHSLESEPDEFGLAGICTSENGEYVFVTYAYVDSEGTLRNGFRQLKPTKKDLGEVFQDSVSGYGHQVGPCQVDINSGYVYLAVGDGLVSSSAQVLNDPRGKILRMDFEGNPVPDNPFYLEDGRNTPSDYIFALGLRNPFGMEMIGEVLYVADNGNAIDRIVQIEAGENYLWDGTDESIAQKNEIVLLDSGGTSTLDYDPDSERFYLVRTKDPPRIQSFRLPSDGIETIARWTVSKAQILSGMAVGEFGEIYFSPLFGSEILVLRRLEEESRGLTLSLGGNHLVRKYGCQGCHQIAGEGGDLGPSLETVQRSEDWITRKLLDPRFESEASIMPNLGLTEPEAKTLAQWLLEDSIREETGIPPVLQWFLPGPGEYPRRWLVAYFWAGSMATVMGIALLWSVWTFIRSLRK